MRIQHNIMSMNAYRNYNNNTNALSKNLEKLSSGYKINRAGDDAAGLAISEKMRAQIQGLSAARKNVKDGISLVKTAEGAMQEIQDMLSRMKYLATQSANGTYDDDVDRKALQDEVDQLNAEINRIADSANFNGTKLLDGSLAGGGASTSTTKVTAPTTAGFTFTSAAGVKAEATITFTAPTKVGLGDMTLTANVNGKDYTVNLQVRKTSGGDSIALFNGDKMIGNAVALTTLGNVPTTGLSPALADVTKLLSDKIAEGLGSTANVSANGGVITITAAEEGANTITVNGGAFSYKKADGLTDGFKTGTVAVATGKEGKDKKYTFDATGFATVAKASAIAEGTYVLNGVKFAFMTDEKEINKVTDKSINIIQLDPTSAANATKIAAQLNQLTGLDMSATSGGTITFRTKLGGSTGGSNGGLQLQIGDTGDSYNQLDVVVKDLHAAAVGCAGVDISTIGGAQAAIDTVKDCINYVSEIRGKLGATQNRLEHTANNLSVMQENIQDAESTIRDTDVADEMMAYTKNNILIQSAQAMLAQANSVPQGVLQLLQ